MASSTHAKPTLLMVPSTLVRPMSPVAPSTFARPKLRMAPTPSSLERPISSSQLSDITKTGDGPPPSSQPFLKHFTQRGDSEVALARKIYLKVYISGFLAVIVTIFAVFPIYWGSLWKVPVKPLAGWIVDLDGGEVGSTVIQKLTAVPNNFVEWTVQPPSRFPGGQSQVVAALLDQQTWVAVTINGGVSDRLANSIASPDPSYNGSEAITMYGVEARNENVYRNYFRPSIQTALDSIKASYAIQQAVNLSTATNLPSLMSVSPQTVISPVSYTIVNLIPFNQSVASAVTFVGLIYSLILTFFVVANAQGAREASRLNKLLQFRSIVIVRLVSSFIAYFFLSLFYSLLSLAFELDFTVKSGHIGFLIFWMVNWIGMLSVGLALESLITILTSRYVPFFMILWIITNVSVSIFPIEMLPNVFRYGYAAPFYIISQAVRTIVFGTKNNLGQNFAFLFIWIVTSCITLTFFEWYIRRKDVAAVKESTRGILPVTVTVAVATSISRHESRKDGLET